MYNDTPCTIRPVFLSWNCTTYDMPLCSTAACNRDRLVRLGWLAAGCIFAVGATRTVCGQRHGPASA